MDIFSREIVGWSISTKHTTDFVVDAFMDVVINFGIPKVAHTNQGGEYKSKDYTKFCGKSWSQRESFSQGNPPGEYLPGIFL